MKRLTPLVLALSLLADSARAAGIGLRWGSCEGASNRNFACDVNNGAELLVVSFSPPPGVDKLTGVEVYGHVEAADGAVPLWWDLFNRGSCRSGSMSASFVLDDVTDCEDTWQGQAMGGLLADGRPGGQGMKFVAAVAIPGTIAHSASPGRTYAALKLVLNHRRSAGSGNCAGCSVPVCITIDKLTLGQPNERGYKNIELTQGLSGLGGAGNVATWQGGTPQCGAGAAKPSSWGALKKIYK